MTIAEYSREIGLFNPNPELLSKNPDRFFTPEMQEWLSDAHIAHIGPLVLPLPREGQTYGGIESVAFNNIRTLDHYGVGHQTVFGNPGNKGMERMFKSVEVILPEGFDPSIDYYNILQTDPKKAAENETQYVWDVYQHIARQRNSITVIHDHTTLGKNIGIMIPDVLGIPVVTTLHGPLKEPDAPLEDVLALRKFIGQNNVRFIPISNNQKSHMPDLPYLTTTYNGVEPSEFELGTIKDGYVMTLSRIAEAKGIHNAIEIARLAGVPLYIAGAVEGTPESIKYFNERINKHIDGKNVIHLGGIGVEERKYRLSHAKALLMPIEWEEPYGMNMAESLMSGTPIVGFRRGSVPELIDHGKTGYVVDSIPEAVASLEKIMNGNIDPLDCRIRAEALFSSPAMAAGNTRNYMDAQLKLKAS